MRVCGVQFNQPYVLHYMVLYFQLPSELCVCVSGVQFNPNYKPYVLYTDGGPADNVKKKKFRGGNEDKEEEGQFSVEKKQAKKKKMRKGGSMERRTAGGCLLAAGLGFPCRCP